MHVVIVESPAKAKTINKYLGPDYHVLASYGHVRDLPAKDGSVLPDEDFSMSWEVDAKAQKRLSDIAKAVKDADRLILATDPDREGEAISWHVLQVLRDKKVLKSQPVERVVFNAITKSSVLAAMANPRQIDAPLVDAYLARRALDYLVGFTLSPVLWRKLPGARSAGRVQSVALRLVCDRELEIETFVTQEYWSILVSLATPKGDVFEARLASIDGRKIGRLDVKTADEARAIAEVLGAARLSVTSVESKPTRRNPYPPFTTSTLQQEASRKLGLPPARTMQIAQRLYEGVDIGGETAGIITYMRTDGVDVAPEAVAAIRSEIDKLHGPRYVPQAPRKYVTKAKNAQEAHEAIRPTDVSRHPADLARILDPEQAKLYELIWKRTVASQMESAEIERTTVDILADAGERRAELRATGSVVRFDGFLTLYQEGRDDEEDEEARRLPVMASGDPLTRKDVNTSQHFTEPPPRYTEATLIKKMEELGIGRPSTYSATLSVLRDREYVRLDRKRLVPEDKGRLVIAFLSSFFERYVEYDFTASLEEQLDRISAGELDWREVLRLFWKDFSHAVDEIKDLRVSQVLDALNDALGPHIFPPREDGTDPRACPSCGNGRLSLKVGKFGSFIGCSNYPECRYTRQITKPGEGEGAAESDGPKVLGTDPATGLEVSLRSGRFGVYVQLGEGEKPKRSSLPRGWEASTLDLEKALALLSLPREVGVHPETGTAITAGIGRYGPFIQHNGTYANLPSADEVFTVGINRAVALLAEKQEKGSRGRPGTAPGRTVGDHPTLGGAMVVRDGRYGPYVSLGKINATLPRGTDAATLTVEQAAALIDSKAEKSPAKPTRGKSTAAKSTAAKTAAADGEAPAKTAKPKTASKSSVGKSSVGKPVGAKPAGAKSAGAKKAPAKAKAGAAGGEAG